jgi:hypothetical protein
MYKKILLTSAFILVIALNVFSIGLNLYHPKEFKSTSSEVNYSSEVNKCFQVYDVKTASYCLRDWIKGFYNYTVRNESSYKDKWGSYEDIKLYGGDCFDYTMLYKLYLTSNDYLTEKVSIYPESEESGHTFLIAYDKNMSAYCKIDQLFVDCLNMEIINEKNETN